MSKRHWTIRFQLMVSVNATVAVIVALFLVYDYQQEVAHRLSDKRTELEEEARILASAVFQIRHHGLETVQTFIDTVCTQMREDDSPGHHIAVRMGSITFQARAHHRQSPEMLGALELAAQSPNRRGLVGGEELVVGVSTQADVTVYVSEQLSTLKHSVRQDVLRRLAAVGILSAAIAAVVNVVLWQIVTRPLQRLVDTVGLVGEGNFGVQTDRFRSVELDFLASAINRMSVSLAAVDRERKTQMAKAREIQRHLLPTNDESQRLLMAHRFLPADEVSGDYYDFLTLSDSSVLICVADVTGHGVPAAMSAAILKTLLLEASVRFAAPDEILRFINQRFAAVTLPGDFATMIIVRIEPEKNRLAYANAGHGPGWLLDSSGKLQQLSSTGLILGVDENAVCDTATLLVSPGDRLLLVTDGITETANENDELFGDERLVRHLEDCRNNSLEETSDYLIQSLVDFRSGKQTDDVTLVLVEFQSATTLSTVGT